MLNGPYRCMGQNTRILMARINDDTTIRWIRGHIGGQGNEEADHRAAPSQILPFSM
ncbi:hypothetical protein BGX38DRAFT_1166297 [Terfezia claveryi]|nr:hypothetical protein BGX38DRAFT_1166297 [Terfezia claveryi]